MNIKKALVAIVATTLVVTAEVKVATVNVAAVFDGYHKTTKTQQEVDVAKKELEELNKTLTTELQDLKKKIDVLAAQINDPATGDQKRIELSEEAQKLNQEGQAKERARLEKVEQKSRAINAMAGENARSIFQEIQAAVNAIGEAEGYDFIYNTAVNGQRGVPVFLYSKKSFDITEKVSAKLDETTTE